MAAQCDEVQGEGLEYEERGLVWEIGLMSAREDVME